MILWPFYLVSGLKEDTFTILKITFFKSGCFWDQSSIQYALSIYVIWGILLHCCTFFLFFHLFLESQDIRQKDNTLEKENKKIYQELNRMLELISKFPDGDRKSYEISR